MTAQEWLFDLEVLAGANTQGQVIADHTAAVAELRQRKEQQTP